MTTKWSDISHIDDSKWAIDSADQQAVSTDAHPPLDQPAMARPG